MRCATKCGMYFLGGAALGAVALYLFDPKVGRGRRRWLKNEVAHGFHDVEDSVEAAGRRLGQRMLGLAAQVCADGVLVPDAVLEERVKSRLGHVLRHAKGLAVRADVGEIILSGTAPKAKIAELVEAAKGVAGVHMVRNWLRDEVEEESEAAREAALCCST
jgi:hypothetical protein